MTIRQLEDYECAPCGHPIANLKRKRGNVFCAACVAENNQPCPHCDGPVSECGGQTYVKRYRCQNDGTEWIDVWCCACNDRCPICNAEIEPYDYDGPDDESEAKPS